jgi:hypothetical protein
VLAVAIISVVLSSVVALAAIIAGARQHRRGLGHEREMADLESVRGSLVDTATILHRAEYAIDDVWLAVTAHGVTIYEPGYPERSDAVAPLREVGRELDQAIGHFRVQLGPCSSATVALEQVGAALLAAYRSVRGIRYRVDARGAPILRVEARNEKLVEKFEKDRDDYKVAVERAHAVAGARLPEAVEPSPGAS